MGRGGGEYAPTPTPSSPGASAPSPTAGLQSAHSLYHARSLQHERHRAHILQQGIGSDATPSTVRCAGTAAAAVDSCSAGAAYRLQHSSLQHCLQHSSLQLPTVYSTAVYSTV